METFDDDVEFIFEKQNLTHLMPPRQMTRLNSAGHNSDKRQKKKLSYLKLLTPEQKAMLLGVFGLDILMFDYKESWDQLHKK